MNIIHLYIYYNSVSANLHGHHQVVIQIHQKKCILETVLPFSYFIYDILVT